MKPIQIGDVVGDYRVIDIAGTGGMGAVYKIEHVITRRIEAMKLLPPAASGDPGQVRRFEREIQVQARLHHPNIVALYNAVRDGDSIALVMEFVEGESLGRKLEAGPLPVATAVDIAVQVLCALAYAHDAGVIHRDVAPANIIITPEGVVKLMDFGLARDATDLRLSNAGVAIGSPWYMSPEQVKAIEPVDARADIYATGAVLHEMLTGGKLFEAEGAFAVMRAHVEATPAQPSSLNSKVPAALDEIVRKAVAKDPAMRFQSADEFRLALLTVAAAIPSMVAPSRSRLRELLPSRAAVMVALLPIALAAGILRLVPMAERVHAPAMQRAAVKRARAPKASAGARIAPRSAPGEKSQGRKAGIVRHRAPVTAHAAPRPGKPAASYAIRVTGGEHEAAVGPALPRVESSGATSAVALQSPVTEGVEVTDAPPAAPDSGMAAEPAPKPSSVGNRLVRAVGKTNSLHGGAKRR